MMIKRGIYEIVILMNVILTPWSNLVDQQNPIFQIPQIWDHDKNIWNISERKKRSE